MSAKLYWDETLPNTTRIDFTGTLHMGDLFDVWEREAAMQRSILIPVYSLNTLHNITPTIQGVNVRKLREFVQHNKPENLQMTVQVAQHGLIYRGLESIASMMSHPVYVVRTLEEGITLIRQHQQQFNPH